MPISSWSSRIRVASGRSPGSTLPPGNSHRPAIALPCGRCAIRTRLSLSTSAQATTRVSLTSPMRRSGAVIAVDRDIFLGEVAGQHAVAAFAHAERDSDLDFRILHRGRDFLLIVGRVARAAFDDTDAVERDR